MNLLIHIFKLLFSMPVIVLTKVDLCDDVDTKLLEIENIAIGVPIIETSIVDEAGLSQIYQYLKEYHTVAFVGSSGVGKSSLINHVLGTDQLETGGLRNDDKGRHTTTHRELFMISGKGMVIDTPGMRELGMWSAQDGIDHTFSDIEELVGKCRFSDCSHGNESGCAVRQAVKDGLITEERYRAYMRLKAENASGCRRSGNSKYIYRCFYYYVWSNIIGYDSRYVTKYRSWKTGDSISGKATWTYIQRIDRYRNVCRSCYFFWWDT